MSGRSFGRLGVHAGTDASVRCSTYPDKAPVLDVDAGPLSVALCIEGRAVTAQAVQFARALAAQAQTFAAEVERLHAAQPGGDGEGKAAAGEAA